MLFWAFPAWGAKQWLGLKKPVITGTWGFRGNFCEEWGDVTWEIAKAENAPHESGLLKLDSSKIRSELGWRPVWDIRQAVHKTVAWEKAESKAEITDAQIDEYCAAMEGDSEWTK